MSRERISITSMSLLLIGLSLSIGWFIPHYYEWTGADQSRMPTSVPITGVGLLCLAAAGSLLLPWVHLPCPVSEHDYDRLKTRWSLRSLLIITAVIAAAAAIFREVPSLAIGCLGLGFACYRTVRFAYRHPVHRWQVLATILSAYGPFAWMVRWFGWQERVSFGSWTETIGMFALPAILPVSLLGSVVNSRLERMVWPSMWCVGAELLLGIWLIRLGPKRHVAYLLWMLANSIVGSFVVNALVRM